MSGVIRCEPSGIVFSSPANIEIPYFEELLPKGVSIDSIDVVSFSNNQLESIPFIIDKNRNVVIAKVSHFSYFAIKVINGDWLIQNPKLDLNNTNNYLTLSFINALENTDLQNIRENNFLFYLNG